MATVQVELPPHSYSVLIEPGGLARLGAQVRACAPSARCSLIADRRVAGLHGDAARRSLEAAGFAVRGKDGDWEPGPELLRIARSLVAHATLPRLAAPMLAELAGATGESVYLAEPVDATTAVYVAMEAGSFAIRHVSWLGRTVPRRGSAVGQALAGRVDADGVVVVEDAVEPGITAVAAPVRGTSGAIEAAVSLVGPSFRLDGQALAEARQLVAHSAARLHSQLAGSAA